MGDQSIVDPERMIAWKKRQRDLPAPALIGRKYHVIHNTRDGKMLGRTILITRIFHVANTIYIHGNCELRNDERTLASHAIEYVTDIETGEVFDDYEEWLERGGIDLDDIDWDDSDDDHDPFE